MSSIDRNFYDIQNISSKLPPIYLTSNNGSDRRLSRTVTFEIFMRISLVLKKEPITKLFAAG